MLSIQPYWVFLIIAKTMGWEIDREKTVEVRKNFPKDLNWNRKSIIYCSKNKKSFNRIPKKYQPLMEKFLGKVIGEFVCDEITEYESEFWDDETYENIKKVIHTMDWDGYPEIDYKFIAENGEENILCKSSCLTWEELRNYIGQGINTFYAWHITDLVIYDKPKELGEFKTKCEEYDKDEPCCEGCKYEHTEYCGLDCPPYFECKCDGLKPIERPPQSWQFIELGV